jgi:hypothetical protein
MTGAPGHRTSQHLVEREAYRRIMAGEAPEHLDELAQQLLEWFRATHPSASPLTLHAVEEQIRATWERRHDLIRGG